MSTKSLTEIEPSHNSPAEMIRSAVNSGADLDKLEKLLTLQERWEANEARKAYHKAISEFKKNPPKITKDKKNSQYKSMYTTLGNLVNTVNPELSRHGLSASWEIKQNGLIEVSCVLTHNMGHSERSSASAPADTSGAKNVIQQIKSTITYLKAVTFESIVGLASSDANYDDDGQASSKDELIDKAQISMLIDYLTSTSTDHKKFFAYMGIESLEQMRKSQYQKALNALKAKATAKEKKK